jgi:hypothetical protein
MIQSPAASQTYSFSGVPNGTYRAFAFVDQNNSNFLDSGDLIYDYVGSLPVVINNNNPTVDLTLSGAASRNIVSTEHWTNGSASYYRLDFEVGGITDLPESAQIDSGQNIPVPTDMQKADNSIGVFACQVDLGAVRPALTDAYRFDVNYYSGTAGQTITPVTAVLDSFVQSISGDATNIPTYSWTAPASVPSFFTYFIEVYDSTTGNLIWYYPSETPFGMPSTQTSVLYNVDGTASQTALTVGRAYYVFVTVRDQYFNSAWYGVVDTPTTAASVVPSGGTGSCSTSLTLNANRAIRSGNTSITIDDACGSTTINTPGSVTGIDVTSGGTGNSDTTGNNGVEGQNNINGSVTITTH